MAYHPHHFFGFKICHENKLFSLELSRFIPSGDAGKDIENLLLALELPLESEILKIGHHGSRHSTLEAFVQAVHPDYSVISVGKNSYGHPHEEVLGTMKKFDTEVLRTDERGDVVFRLYSDRIVLPP